MRWGRAVKTFFELSAQTQLRLARTRMKTPMLPQWIIDIFSVHAVFLSYSQAISATNVAIKAQCQARMKPTDELELRNQLELHHSASYGWALYCCANNPVEAEDVLQTVYLKILDGRARYRGSAGFRTWLFEVIRRTAANERRRYWLCKLGLARFGTAKPPAIGSSNPSETVHKSQLQALFRQALATLPQRQQEVLHLVFYQDLTVQEAASVMGVSVGSARQHYERGKQRLRERIETWEEFHG